VEAEEGKVGQVPDLTYCPFIPPRDRSPFRSRAARGAGPTLVIAMKLRLALALLALATPFALRAADALPVFNATLTMGKEHRFVLVDASGKASSFLNLGDTFAGVTLKAFDAKTGVLDVERGGQISHLTIAADAATLDAPAARVPATIADAEAILNRIHFEDMMDRALAQQKKMLAGQFEKMGGAFTSKGADPKEVADFQKKVTDEVLSVMDGKRLKDDMAKIYTEVFSKDELDQIGAFYQTPFGQLMLSKQPEVQGKLGTIIQQRMGEVMPRVQKMTQEFAAEQKAKMPAAGGVSPPVAPPPPATAPKQ